MTETNQAAAAKDRSKGRHLRGATLKAALDSIRNKSETILLSSDGEEWTLTAFAPRRARPRLVS